VLPGSKRVVDDLMWLKQNNFTSQLTNKEKTLVTICGGYEMMFEHILDKDMVESRFKKVSGFGRIKGSVNFQKEKIVQKGTYRLFGCMVDGYEIHNGIAKKRVKKKKNLYATFVHGLFDSDEFRYKLFYKINKNYKGYNFKEFKNKAIKEYAEFIALHVDIKHIIKKIG
jgi:adenosylcobyric acid synthase